ncbi:MAG: hypothetical protein AAB071_02085 [Bacteroidota bacterium]
MKQNLYLRVKLSIVFVFISLGSYTSMYACDSLIVKGTLTASGSPAGVIITVQHRISTNPDVWENIRSGTTDANGWYYIDVTAYTEGDLPIRVIAECCQPGVGIDKTSGIYSFVNCYLTINVNCSGECDTR